ncbi:cell wall assembly protein Knr4 [Streptomyces carminius]|uniref:Cell wall assembly protein Knr4 n=1 Tax=Streptomyces carminius TaxID=2665496 RepID=A0A2M8LV11_9ACTN|nr:SMI1/KNR4 family protein [Streptomyces carminius]PJE95785.1 cell wall assembly protein Knr4 [Streptomyces carminius]
MTDTDPAAFDAAWDRFSSWLSAHAPVDHAALLPPATAEEIAGLEARLGFPLHPQLRALLRRHNGVMEHVEPDNLHAGAFLPIGHRLNTVDHIVLQHGILEDGLADLLAEGVETEDEPSSHAHQWVAFAHPNDGGITFIDHCPGPAYGHVYEMGIGSGAVEPTKWASSLAGLFDALTESLETGEPFRRYWWPTPYELPSGHFCLDWDHRPPAERDGSRGWPPPRPLDAPLRPPSPANRRGLGRCLGPLIPPRASQVSGAAVRNQASTSPAGPLHASGKVVTAPEGPEDPRR